MKKELMKALGKRYKLENDNTIVDTSVGGFDHLRNVAQVREVRGKLVIKLYDPTKRWFSSDESFYANTEEAAKYIKGVK